MKMTQLPNPTNSAPAANVAITLNAVFVAIEHESPKVLCTCDNEDVFSLPYGPFHPERHRTFEIGVREWVERQTQLSLGHIEQLYTFGDMGREATERGANGERIVSVGYLAIADAPSPVDKGQATWRDWYTFFPWEDWRDGEPEILRQEILPRLDKWAREATSAARKDTRRRRINISFGRDEYLWEEARILDRYELMYEARLVAEVARDHGDDDNSEYYGAAMAADHRRILATAISRVRGKLRYRPIIFEMTPPEFTLLRLQLIIEAIVGFPFHKQNFRRSVEKSGMVERTSAMATQASGRPAALYRVNRAGLREQTAIGLAFPKFRGSIGSG